MKARNTQARTIRLHAGTVGVVLLMLSSTLFGQSISDATSQDERDADALRRTYLTHPELTISRVNILLTDKKSEFRKPLPLFLRGERLLEALEKVFREKYGVSFLHDNPFAVRLVDSLRTAFYSNPSPFDDDRMAHLEMASRAADGRPFARASTELLRLLADDREHYFDDPGTFSTARLRQLDLVSMRVTSLPFLRGSPDLVEHLRRVKENLEHSGEAFSPDRLEELNAISMEVTGAQFVEETNYRLLVGLVAATGVVVLFLLVSARRVRWRTVEIGPKPDERPPAESFAVTVASACRILRVEPDCSLDELVSAYRAQQKRYHPDVVAHLGAELQQMAELRTRRINEAYELMKKRLEGK